MQFTSIARSRYFIKRGILIFPVNHTISICGVLGYYWNLIFLTFISDVFKHLWEKYHWFWGIYFLEKLHRQLKSSKWPMILEFEIESLI